MNKGDRFNFLVFQSVDPENKKKGLFLCDCGCTKSITINDVRRGRNKSCGCKKAELCGDATRKHGLGKSKLWNVWASLDKQVSDPNALNEVSEEWRGQDGFLHFLRDMGAPPNDDSVVVRCDITKAFSKDNCVWGTSENAKWTKGKPANNTSGVKGVSFHTRLKKWQAYVSKNHVRYQKFFPPTDGGLTEAIMWVRKKREELHGEFTNHG